MKLIFARHGETKAGVQDRFVGLSDSPLAEEGRKQAKHLAEFCKGESVGKIYSSPLGRARKTSREVAKACKLRINYKKELKEICYGEWEGKRREDVKILREWKEREKHFYTFLHPGEYNQKMGESYEMLYVRLAPFFARLETSNEEKNILVISHNGVIRCARKYYEEITNDEFKNGGISNDHVYIVEKKDEIITTSRVLF